MDSRQRLHSHSAYVPYTPVSFMEQSTINPTRIYIKAIIFCSIAIILSALLIVMFYVDWTASLQFHTDMEVVSTLLALIIGIVALVHFYSDKTNIFLFIGTGFLGAAFLDCYHFLVTADTFSFYLSTKLIAMDAWSWIASRFFISLFLCLSSIASLTTLTRGKLKEQSVSVPYVYCMAALLALVSFGFFIFVPLPASYYPSILFHSPIEFIPGILFAIALAIYLARGRWKVDPFEFWLILFLIVSVILQVCYMSLSGKLFDTMFNVSHVLKVISYAMVLIGLLISVHDRFKFAVESSKKLELYSKRLEESNQDLEQFAYIASHDLKEPLRKIGSFSTFLEKEYKELLPEKGRDYINRMQNAVQRMNALIESLLNYSRISRKTMLFRFIDLNKVIKTVINDLDTSIKSTGAEIKIIDKLPYFEADPIQLQQVMQNLISNAIKFHRRNEKPLIQISSKLIGKKYGVHYCISVKDNGIGFDEKYANKIFGVFQRLHGLTEYEGSGVGLAICKKIIKRHHGEINVQSKVGNGTTVNIILPVYQDGIKKRS